MVTYVVGTEVESGTVASTATPTGECTRAFICLRPSLSSVERFLSSLYAMRYRYPDVDMTISGLSVDSRCLRVTVGLALNGCEGAVEKAFTVANDIFDNLAAYAPHYTGVPDGDAARAARNLPRRFTARAAPMPRSAWESVAFREDE